VTLFTKRLQIPSLDFTYLGLDLFAGDVSPVLFFQSGRLFAVPFYLDIVSLGGLVLSSTRQAIF
jgi:hypothetical protein